jgi:aldehyde:ferredoxin oxidoreductase
MSQKYIFKYLNIDLTNQSFRVEHMDEDIGRKFLGGYGIGANFLYENMPKATDPLGPENILGLLTGPLTGTPLPFVSRFAAVAKSPLTGCWGDANGSGYFGPKLRAAGFDGLFFTGISERPVYLLIDSGEYKLYPASDIWGKDTYETEDYFKSKYGDDAETACIGPSGEKKSKLASIVTAKGRVAARGGLGAVMGSKLLKAVVVKGGGQIFVADKEATAGLRKKICETDEGRGRVFRFLQDNRHTRSYRTRFKKRRLPRKELVWRPYRAWGHFTVQL